MGLDGVELVMETEDAFGLRYLVALDAAGCARLLAEASAKAGHRPRPGYRTSPDLARKRPSSRAAIPLPWALRW